MNFKTPIGVLDVEPGPWILNCPNIPKPLHGLAPRTIKGDAWWDTERQKAYASTNYHCFACGIHKSKALYHQWLEAHEVYQYDYEKARLVFLFIIPLCHACHNYIHDGRMLMMTRYGRMSKQKYDAILQRGLVLSSGSVYPDWLIINNNNSNLTNWSDWRMVVDGKEHGPNHNSYEDWVKFYSVK